MKLWMRLTLLLGALSVIPLLIVGLVSYHTGRQTLERSTLRLLASVAIDKAHEVDEWVTSSAHALEALARQQPVVYHAATLVAEAEIVGEQSSEYQLAHMLLREQYLPRYLGLGNFESLTILDSRDGRVLVSTDPALEGMLRADEPFFVYDREGTYVGGIHLSLAPDEAVMHITTPIVDKEGTVVAVLDGHADLSRLREIMIETTGLSASEKAYLIDSQGYFVTPPRPEDKSLVLATRNDSQGAQACLALARGTGEDTVESPVGQSQQAGCHCGPPFSGIRTGSDLPQFGALPETHLYDDYRGIPVIGIYRWIPDLGVCLLAEVDQVEMLAPVAALRRLMVYLGLGVAVASVVAVVLFARRMGGQIEAIVLGAEQIGQGDLAHRIRVRSRDELGRIAQGFNTMAVNLRRSMSETAHNQQLVVSLSQAVQDVQRARTPEAVYRTVGEHVADLGYHAAVFEFTEDKQDLRIAYLTFDSSALRAAEKLVGATARDYRLPVEPGSVYERVVRGGEAVYVADVSSPLAESLPRGTRAVAAQILSLLGLQQAICVPLRSEDECVGMIVVAGSPLTEGDVPAITGFATQAAIALENARLYHEIEQHAAELEQRVAWRKPKTPGGRQSKSIAT